jgi:ATP-dependent Lhr-like helicase
MAIQRMRAEDLLAAVFPEQLMCQDNRVGAVELPDHPLVNETIRDCLYEAMDLDGLREALKRIENGKVRTLVVETPAPSPMAHEILNANPYAFLDDAPLEERRARAVSLRRTDPELATGIGALSSQAIEEVRQQAWPKIRDAEDLHDFLLGVCLLPLDQAREWSAHAEDLMQQGRATVVSWRIDGEVREAYVAAEQVFLAAELFPEAEIHPKVKFLPGKNEKAPSFEEAARSIVQGWMEILGPTTVSSLAQRLGFPQTKVEQALLALEAGGFVLRGRFTQASAADAAEEWCERGLLSRIHRLTLGQLRKEIEPVMAADFMRFLLCWQHVQPDTQLRGREAILEVIGQLQGLELPAPAWEQHVLPSRIADYDPADLESLCLAGAIAWGRAKVAGESYNEEKGKSQNSTGRQDFAKRGRKRLTFTRVAPITFILREDLGYFIEAQNQPQEIEADLSSPAGAVARYLRENGASFLGDIARGTGLLKSQAEEALWELVARGLVTGDGIAGLRVLLTPEAKRQGRRRRLRVLSGGRSVERLMPVGRWSLWRSRSHLTAVDTEQKNEFYARQLLRRYGVVLRELLARENSLLSWRQLLQTFRRLEARGEIRGGRFVNGFVGEQYALPEAVGMLRALRRSHADGKAVVVSSADPLNLVGILTPGERVSPYSNQSIVYSDGVPVDIGPLGAIRGRLNQPQAISGD